MAIGENVKRLRQDKGLTQKDLSKISGVKTALISKIERNDANTNVSTIYKLMNSLECSADSIFFDEENINSDAGLKMIIEKMKGLPEDDIRAITGHIDALCIANGIDNIFKNRKLAILTKPIKRIKNS